MEGLEAGHNFGRLRGGLAKLAFIGREHYVIFLYVRLIFQAPTLLRIIAASRVLIVFDVRRTQLLILLAIGCPCGVHG